MSTASKTYIALVRDHSISMSNIRAAAARDFNTSVESIRDNAIKNKQDTFISVIECGRGFGGSIRTVERNVSVTKDLSVPSAGYTIDGQTTPLYDAVGEAIDVLNSNTDPTAAFLVVVTTDGGENSSKRWSAYTIADRIRELTRTDRWTFVFRVPKNVVGELIRAGIPAANILGWDPSLGAVEVERTTRSQSRGFDQYFTARSAGITSSQKFYADLTHVNSNDVEYNSQLKDVSTQISLWPVAKGELSFEIRPFVESRLKRVMQKGAAFYQLTKTEPVIQDYKVIAIRDKSTNAIYAGADARRLLKIPLRGNIKLVPGNLGNFDVFIQSTSVNRKLIPGTQVLYWEGANAGSR